MANDAFCLTDNPQEYHDCFMESLRQRNPNENEFLQAVQEVSKSLLPFLFENRKYLEARILERMTEPDRVISFRVTWENDQGEVRINRGYRVQFNNSIGPYKGGLRFHPSVNESILKFLGFEQILKNSLTGLPIGGGKGGANFNPRGKSDREIMRFCQAFMTELYRHIGPETDVPAGDIGVGAREISYLFGQYKRMVNRFNGVLTGKGLEFGGSLIRTEATGYGLVYFTQNVLHKHSQSIEDQKCIISGAGNVAQYTAEKLLSLKAKILCLSDSQGCLYFPQGLQREQLESIKKLKRRGKSLAELDDSSCEFKKGKTPWEIACDFAFPCATQNELNLDDMQKLIEQGCRGVFEGANMPCTNEAIDYCLEEGILFGPSKAANAGGVAISAIEMAQNNIGMRWEREQVDQKLQEIMANIHKTCVEHGEHKGKICYVSGANIGGFVKVANAMLAYGIN